MQRKWICVSFVLLAVLGAPFAANPADGRGNGAQGKTGAAFERKAILAALRSEVRRMSGLDVVFVVQDLRVADGWAWVETLPQSPDGKNRYEPVSGLLKRTGNAWRVLEVRPTECDDGEDEWCDDHRYFEGVKRRHPDAPARLFAR